MFTSLRSMDILFSSCRKFSEPSEPVLPGGGADRRVHSAAPKPWPAARRLTTSRAALAVLRRCLAHRSRQAAAIPCWLQIRTQTAIAQLSGNGSLSSASADRGERAGRSRRRSRCAPLASDPIQVHGGDGGREAMAIRCEEGTWRFAQKMKHLFT